MKILVYIFLVLVTTTEIRTEDSDTESKELNHNQTLSSSTSKLDENLRKALLRALTELENEDKTLEVDRDQIIERAHASSVSIFANSGSVSSSTFAPLSTSTIRPQLENDQEATTEKTHVLFQKSTAVNQKTITTIESDNEIDNEQILTSASNSFADQYSKPALNEKVVRSNVNSIDKNEKSTRVPPTTTTTTTSLPPTSTEENEAKVEDVQFFSAPLVAAFTVHQDELGLPKSIEPIYKLINPTKVAQKNEQKVEEQNQNELLEKQQTQFLHQNELRKGLQSQQNGIQSVQSRQKQTSGNEIQPQNGLQSQFISQNNLQSRQKGLSQNNHISSHNELQPNHKIVNNLQQFGQQNDLHSKLSAQELEIQRLNLNLKQQQQINQQQQQALFSTQHQQALLSNQQRLNTKETPFLPIINPVQQSTIQQIPNREAELFKQKHLPCHSFQVYPLTQFWKQVNCPQMVRYFPSKVPVIFMLPLSKHLTFNSTIL
nr:unnamed protein product [Callosobruchus chinensis]